MKTLAFVLMVLSVTSLGNGETKYLSIGKLKPTKATRGKSLSVKLVIIVKKGFHIQANPASKKYLIPTTLKVEPQKDITIGKTVYPKKVKPYRLKGSKDAINTYEGTFHLAVPVTIGKPVKAGKRELSAKLRYQACDETTCFFPTTAAVKIPLIIQ